MGTKHCNIAAHQWKLSVDCKEDYVETNKPHLVTIPWEYIGQPMNFSAYLCSA